MLHTPEDLSDDQIEVWQQAAEFFHRAYQHQLHGDYATAMQEYRRSLTLYPTAEAHTFLGWVYGRLRLFDEAIAECMRAIEVDPRFGNAYNDIGAWLVESGRSAEAIPWFEQATRAPRYAEPGYPHYNLGHLYEARGRWRQALHHYAEAVRLQPRYRAARAALAHLEGRLN